MSDRFAFAGGVVQGLALLFRAHTRDQWMVISTAILAFDSYPVIPSGKCRAPNVNIVLLSQTTTLDRGEIRRTWVRNIEAV